MSVEEVTGLPGASAPGVFVPGGETMAKPSFTQSMRGPQVRWVRNVAGFRWRKHSSAKELLRFAAPDGAVVDEVVKVSTGGLSMSSVTVSNAEARWLLSGGVDGQTYAQKLLVTTKGGQVIQLSFDVEVEDEARETITKTAAEKLAFRCPFGAEMDGSGMKAAGILWPAPGVEDPIDTPLGEVQFTRAGELIFRVHGGAEGNTYAGELQAEFGSGQVAVYPFAVEVR